MKFKVDIPNRFQPPPQHETVFLSAKLVLECGCTRATVMNWLHNYTVDGQPLGWKVGGRWLVDVTLLKRFLKGEGERKTTKAVRKRRKRQ